MERHSENPNSVAQLDHEDRYDLSHLQYRDKEGRLVLDFDLFRDHIFRIKRALSIFSPSNISTAMSSLKEYTEVVISDLKEVHSASKHAMMKGLGGILDQIEAQPEAEGNKTAMQKLRQKFAEFWTREEHLTPIGTDETWGDYLKRRQEWWNTYKKKDYTDPALRADI